MGMDVTGVRDALAALKRIPTDVTGGLTQAVREEANDIQRDEQAAVPVKSGALQSGIQVRTTGPLSAEVGVYDNELVYAIWIEWGKAGRDGTPFATPAAELSVNRWPARVADAVKRAL